jgi:hypothetical protein
VVLGYYAHVNNYKVDVIRTAPYVWANHPAAPMEMGEPKEITLAEYDARTENLITAHRLRDYRKRTFTLVMLPDVKLLVDYLLEAQYGCTA